MAINTSILGSLLIPLQNKLLLLPNVSVAELIPFKKPVPATKTKTPDWHLGTLSWRGVSVPVISFEVLNGDTAAELDDDTRIAVFNEAGDSEKLPFFAMVTRGIPRSIKITAVDVVKNNEKVGPAEVMAVTVQGEQAIIPNVDFIEKAILKAKIV